MNLVVSKRSLCVPLHCFIYAVLMVLCSKIFVENKCLQNVFRSLDTALACGLQDLYVEGFVVGGDLYVSLRRRVCGLG